MNFFSGAKLFVQKTIEKKSFAQILKNTVYSIIFGSCTSISEPIVGIPLCLMPKEFFPLPMATPSNRLLTIGKDRSLKQTLIAADINPILAQDISACVPKYLAMHLKSGQKIGLFFNDHALTHVKIYSGIAKAWLLQPNNKNKWQCRKSCAPLKIAYQRLSIPISQSFKKSLLRQSLDKSFSTHLIAMCAKSGIPWGVVSGSQVDLVCQVLINEETKERALNHIAMIRILNNGNTRTFYAHRIASRQNQLFFYTLSGMGSVLLASHDRNGSGCWGSPVSGKMKISSHFGRRSDPFRGVLKMHAGIDVCGHHGVPILAVGDGRVSAVNYVGSYGRYIEITHAGGYQTLYAHLSSSRVRVGMHVRKGQPIGTMGMTGRATGPHLHLEIKRNGSKINPMHILASGSKNTHLTPKLTSLQMKRLHDYARILNKKYIELGGSLTESNASMHRSKRFLASKTKTLGKNTKKTIRA